VTIRWKLDADDLNVIAIDISEFYQPWATPLESYASLVAFLWESFRECSDGRHVGDRYVWNVSEHDVEVIATEVLALYAYLGAQDDDEESTLFTELRSLLHDVCERIDPLIHNPMGLPLWN
jgi:hypothetical protein